MPSQPVFSLAYTSARAGLIAGVLAQWFGHAKSAAAVEAVVCVDAPDAEPGRGAVASSPWAAQTRLVLNEGPRTCVAGWNEAARHIRGDVIVAISDDFAPPPAWDAALIDAGPDGWWREDRVVAVSDGYVYDIFTLAILTRARLERFGYLFHPAYASLFCDTEYTSVASGECAVIDARHLLFEHRHHGNRKRAKDNVDRRHASPARWTEGEALFLSRQRAGFPAEPRTGAPAPPPAAAGEISFALCIQANKDDFALAEVARAILAQQEAGNARLAAVFLFCPDEYWSGRPTPGDEIARVRDTAAALAAEWPAVKVCFRLQAVAPHRIAAGSRTEIEARVRNTALAEIRRAGHEHVLIADADELWRPGTLAEVAQSIRKAAPPALLAGMIPIAGLPGYPVDRAQDLATIYMGPGASFVICRSACGIRQVLPGRPILHFTATRRTMDEIAHKHRDSGHYGDPDYDFEDWIANVLPTIKPGRRNVHMFRPKQIWPRIRRWRREELAVIPASLRLYLGSEVDSPWRDRLRAWFGG